MKPITLHTHIAVSLASFRLTAVLHLNLALLRMFLTFFFTMFFFAYTSSSSHFSSSHSSPRCLLHNLLRVPLLLQSTSSHSSSHFLLRIPLLFVLFAFFSAYNSSTPHSSYLRSYSHSISSDFFFFGIYSSLRSSCLCSNFYFDIIILLGTSIVLSFFFFIFFCLKCLLSAG